MTISRSKKSVTKRKFKPNWTQKKPERPAKKQQKGKIARNKPKGRIASQQKESLKVTTEAVCKISMAKTPTQSLAL